MKGRLELALRLFLVAMLLDPPLPWSERVPVLVLAGAGLAVPEALRSRWLWGALFVATALPLAFSWPFPDNHDYVTAAFALAGACAFLTADAEAAMARSARLLVAITFSMAMLWKAVLSPDFLDGRFFSVTLLTDGRFEDLAVLTTDLDWDGWEENDQALGDVLAGEVPPERSTFHAPPRLRAVAAALTVATLLVEGAVALCFLWPGRRGPARLRDAALLLFLVGTYSFATVRGFGWLLVALGVAQSDPERTGTRWGYLGAFALIGIYRAVPWTSWLVERFAAG